MSITDSVLTDPKARDRIEQSRWWPARWFLLEGNRYSVTAALLLSVFVTIYTVGSLWTPEMRQLLTETSSVQTLLNTILGGIILLVSIVASISAIVLSYDITSLDAQEQRINAAMEFRQDLGQLSDAKANPTDPGSFLEIMSKIIESRASNLRDASKESDSEVAEEIEQYTDSVSESIDVLNNTMSDIDRGEFSALWRGLEVDYGDHLNRSRRISLAHEGQFSESGREEFDELVRAFELFAMGKEYFKTLYYTQEVSRLSRTLLVISFPAILVTASAILALGAHLLPDLWLLGLPPLLTFVSLVFTVSLAPFAVLTSYMLRVATVAGRTASAGPFTLE